MEGLRGTRQKVSFDGVWTTLLCAMLLSATGYLNSLASAQTACGVAQTASIRVHNQTELGRVRAAVSCIDGGVVEVYWAGYVALDSPISISKGTFLSVTGEDILAEVHGDSNLANGTRLFEVSPGGGLALTQVKVTGGTAGVGGAIYSSYGILTLSSCIFDGNGATSGSGGAVWATGGNVTITGGEFLGNKATQYGGAVYATDGRLEIQGGSKFEGNEASIGGALFCGSTTVRSAKLSVFCSLIQTKFTFNRATHAEWEGEEGATSSIDAGGAAAFQFADATVNDSVFSANYAQRSGGALFGGPLTNISVNGCTITNNTSNQYGGAISASSMTLGGNTQLADNSARTDGGAVYGWDASGTINFNDVIATYNSALGGGGCCQGWGTVIVNNGTVMLDNHARHGGSIYADTGSTIVVNGGLFTSRTSHRGGFLYGADNITVTITGGMIADNVVASKGGAIYCSGYGVSTILIEGGTFRNNTALEAGGAIAVWGADVLVATTGGTFENNTASYYGGFIFLEVMASLNCGGSTITGNFAGEQGGGIYAREATLVNCSCDLIANESPKGAAIYLVSVVRATFANHDITGNLASSGSVVDVSASSVVAKQVTLVSSVGVEAYSSNRAIQLDEHTTLDAERCVFDGWVGDTVIYNLNSASGSLVLDSCDFSGSAAVLVVMSPNSDAEIRNAVVSTTTFKNAVVHTPSKSLTLVDRALDCSVTNVCGAGECVNSTLGVLCQCLDGGECLHDGGELSLSLKTSPAGVTFSPDTVSYELVVSSAGDGTTNAIWDLDFEADFLDLSVVPSSGVLRPGTYVTLTVTATPSHHGVGGDLTSAFSLSSVGKPSTNSTGGVKLEVVSTFYLCQAYEYAMPQNGDETDDVGVSCGQCLTIDGMEGLDCQRPGATLASLPIRHGYWRSGPDSLVVHECINFEACVGATEISSADDYCANGYKGPYCVVCAEGYGRSLGNTCFSCNGTRVRLLYVAGAIFSVLALLLLFLAVVFLIGGTDAISIVRQGVVIKLSLVTKASNAWCPVKEEIYPHRNKFGINARIKSMSGTMASVFKVTSELRPSSSKVGTGWGKRSPSNLSETCDPQLMHPRPLADGAVLSSTTRRRVDGDETGPDNRHTRVSSLMAGGVPRAEPGNGGEVESIHGEGGICGALDKTIKQWSLTLSWNKIKILVGVWQILSVFSSITGVEFPDSYSVFLSWINVLNFDLGYIVSASCAVTSLNFYQRLLATTLPPFVVVAGLGLTYWMAKRRSGIGSAGVIARHAAWSRHVTAGLLLTFMVFTSASSEVLKTFACDDKVVGGESYLRADYSISCNTSVHRGFKLYAGVMILVYPIGIPMLYFFVLWRKRELLNPRIHSRGTPESDCDSEDDTGSGFVRSADDPSAILLTASNGQTKAYWSPQELQELDERVKRRTENPELVPFMFLWRDFGPNLYFYEVVECGRRILLTEVLIFIAPQSAKQAAMACIFAFLSLLGFELLRPHADQGDSWLYRLGCVMIFMTYFLALLIKMDAAGEANRSALGGCLVAVNVFLIVAVLCAAWFAIRRIADKPHQEGNSSA